MAMDTKEKKKLTVKADIKALLDKVWECWTEPNHITQWNNASDDWHTPKAENDLRVGKSFVYRMEAKDGSAGFDYEGKYKEVKDNELIAYTLGDGREVEIVFEEKADFTRVTETFEAENTFSLEMQREGWQSILYNFKRYVESQTGLDTMKFEITIEASAEKVFLTMLDKDTYAEWTVLFSPGSHFEGTWEKGSKILFLAPDKDGEMGGLVSRIKEKIPNEFISIEHLGVVKNGEEIISGPEVGSWAGWLENYAFEENNGQTTVKVTLDTDEEYRDYFTDAWPKALEKLKEICES
jgi:uncharacterized protein YndB with AHSA1/START domain